MRGRERERMTVGPVWFEIYLTFLLLISKFKLKYFPCTKIMPNIPEVELSSYKTMVKTTWSNSNLFGNAKSPNMLKFKYSRNYLGYFPLDKNSGNLVRFYLAKYYNIYFLVASSFVAKI